MDSSVWFVKKYVIALLAAIFVAGLSPLMAADSSAKVTEAVNDVARGSSQAAETSPAKVGTAIQDGEFLKTGVKSRAELQLADQTITRIGANTIFNYSAANNEIDLQAGTVLFSKPKDGKEMTIKTASVTAAIVGTTGFFQLLQGKNFIFGLVEGHAVLTVGGVKFNVAGGQVLRLNAGTAPELYSFNLPVFLKTCPLIILFTHPLPNQAFIDKAVAEYDNAVARGFIQQPTEHYFITDFGGFVPNVPVIAHDSAGASLNGFNHPPPPPNMIPGGPGNPEGGPPPFGSNGP